MIVTDDLAALGSDEEVVAVVAHELGHLHELHSLRQLIQASVVGGATAYWLGDMSGLAAGLSAMVLETKYSRDFEWQADEYAARLLRAERGQRARPREDAGPPATRGARRRRPAGSGDVPVVASGDGGPHPAVAGGGRPSRPAAGGCSSCQRPHPRDLARGHRWSAPPSAARVRSARRR